MKRNILIVILLCFVAYGVIVAFHNNIFGRYQLAVFDVKGKRIGNVTLDVSFEFIPKYHWLDQRMVFSKTINCDINMLPEEYRTHNGLHTLSGYSAGYFDNGYFFSGEDEVVVKYDKADGWQMAVGEFMRDRFSLK